ncbi:hypothetical protein OC844_007421 [Tilletia horrida]|nr:hypothetical protein OC844_007421 [Tilletia horrida]
MPPKHLDPPLGAPARSPPASRPKGRGKATLQDTNGALKPASAAKNDVKGGAEDSNINYAAVLGAAIDAVLGSADGLEALSSAAAAVVDVTAAAAAAAAADDAEARPEGIEGFGAAPASPYGAKAKGKRKKADSSPHWKNDAAAPGRPSFMTVLLTWLQDDGNYDKWKGSEGDTQLALAADVAQRIKEAETKAARTPAAIVEKIKTLEKHYRQASGFRQATGQGLLDQAAALDEENREEAMRLTEKSVEDAILNYCPHYFELVEVMADRVSTDPTASFSTTSTTDPAAAFLRAAVAGRGRNEEDDDFSDDGSDQDSESGPDDKKAKINEKPGPAGKKVKIEKGDRKARPSNTGRKFGKTNSSTPKRKPSAVEVALEDRSRERTKMDTKLTDAKVKSEKLGAIMGIARELRAFDATLTFADALESAKELYGSI